MITPKDDNNNNNNKVLLGDEDCDSSSSSSRRNSHSETDNNEKNNSPTTAVSSPLAGPDETKDRAIDCGGEGGGSGGGGDEDTAHQIPSENCSSTKDEKSRYYANPRYIAYLESVRRMSHNNNNNNNNSLLQPPIDFDEGMATLPPAPPPPTTSDDNDMVPADLPPPPQEQQQQEEEERPGAYARGLGTIMRRLSHVRFSLFSRVQQQPPVVVGSSGNNDVGPGNDVVIVGNNNQNDTENNNTIDDVNGDSHHHDGPLPSFNNNEQSTTAAAAEEEEEEEWPPTTTTPSPNNNIDEELAVATAITYDDDLSVLLEAEELDPEVIMQKMENKERKRKKLRMIGCAIIAICSIVLSLALGLSIGRGEMAPSASQPTVPPAQSSTRPLLLLENLELLYTVLPERTKESLNDSESPQYRAWEWLLNHPYVSSYPEWRKKQVFAMATFYYSFEGPNWPKATAFGHDRWMNPSIIECSWPTTRAELSFFLEQGFQVFGKSAYEYEVFHPCNQDGKLQSLVLIALDLPSTGGLASPSIPPEIEFLTSLKIMGIAFSKTNAKLSDIFVPELVNLPNLEGLNFYKSGITGSIPQGVFRMADLRHLVFGANKLDKSILPTEISMMTSLEYFNLHNTSGISGKLPSELGLMTTLTGLDLSWSSFTGSIPTELGALTNMGQLSLDANRFSGTIPSQLGLLTGNTWLSLYENRLTGSLPSELGLMTNADKLRIWNNALTGSIPSEWGLMTNMIDFGLGNDLEVEGPHNDFSGSLPEELWEFSHLKWIFLPNLPNISGRVPTNLVTPNLTMLRLEGSPRISGVIPQEVCFLQARELGDTDYEMMQKALDFDCSFLLCGCDCPCVGGGSSNGTI